MKVLLVVALAVIVLAVTLPAQAICKNCVSNSCTSTQTGYVNCMSNGSSCSKWTSCLGAGGGGDCGGENPPCEQGLKRPATEWRLASVEVRPAPKTDVRWRLASVETVQAATSVAP